MASSESASPNPQVGIKQSELVGRKVLELNTAAELGQLQEVWVDPRHHQVMGFSCTAGPLGIRRRYFPWTHLEHLGDEAIMVSLVAGIEPQKPKTAERALSHEVWTNRGDRVGVVVDYRINPETGDVVDYLFTTDAWGGLASGTYALPVAAVVSMNDTRLIGQEAALQAAEVYTGSMSQQAAAFFQDDLDRTRQDVSSVFSGAKSIADQFKQRTRTLAEQSQQRLNEAVEQTKEQREAIAEQAQSKWQEVSEQLQERREDTQERLANKSRQLQDNATKFKGQVQNTTQKLSADARKRLKREDDAEEPPTDISLEEFEDWDAEERPQG